MVIIKTVEAVGVVHMAEYLLSKHEALSSNPSTSKKEKREKKKKQHQMLVRMQRKKEHLYTIGGKVNYRSLYGNSSKN
jgi:hypothetical protein